MNSVHGAAITRDIFGQEPNGARRKRDEFHELSFDNNLLLFWLGLPPKDGTIAWLSLLEIIERITCAPVMM